MISSHWGAEEQEKGHGGYVLEEVCGTFRTLLVFKPESWTRSQLVVVKRDLARERHVSALAEVTGLLRLHSHKFVTCLQVDSKLTGLSSPRW
jgi:hypothetical protein